MSNSSRVRYVPKKIPSPPATTFAFTFPHGSAGWGMTCRQVLGSPYCTYRVHTYSVHTASTLMTVHRNFREGRCRMLSRVSSCNGCHANHALSPFRGEFHERHPWGGKNDACPGSKPATAVAAKGQERTDRGNVMRLLVTWNWGDVFYSFILLDRIEPLCYRQNTLLSSDLKVVEFLFWSILIFFDLDQLPSVATHG